MRRLGGRSVETQRSLLDACPPSHQRRSHSREMVRFVAPLVVPIGTCARPMGGYIIMLLNAAIDWSARCVKIVPDSTCEAEMAQASRGMQAR